MVEEIITALSRIRTLFVIARNSSFTYKDQAIDVKRVGRELGVRYVLEGSVRKASGRVRITARLIDAFSGTDRSEDRKADAMKGADFARRALEVAGDDPGILANAAFALAFLGEDIGAMMALADRALTLNPNFARGWNISGCLRLYADQLDSAIEHLEASLRLSPRARIGTPLVNIGAAHFFARRFDEAAPKLLLAIQEDPTFPWPYRALAACYAHIGRLDDARKIVARLRAITSLVISDISYTSDMRNAEHRELLLSGLRLAAGEAM
jgi:tetratricopeptide (TPR) repeat protein